ncbi:hypothetical protein Lser_V15G28990 [Lactuca serriola]
MIELAKMLLEMGQVNLFEDWSDTCVDDDDDDDEKKKKALLEQVLELAMADDTILLLCGFTNCLVENQDLVEN